MASGTAAGAPSASVPDAWAAGPLGCFLGLGAAAGDADRRVVSSGPWVARLLSAERGRLASFAAIMPSFWDELILMAAPDAAGHTWTRASLVSWHPTLGWCAVSARAYVAGAKSPSTHGTAGHPRASRRGHAGSPRPHMLPHPPPPFHPHFALTSRTHQRHDASWGAPRGPLPPAARSRLVCEKLWLRFDLSYPPAPQTAIMNTVFRRAMEQDRVYVSWDQEPVPSSPDPALRCGKPSWAVFNTGLHTRAHQQLFARLHPFSAAVVAGDLMQDGSYASPKSTKDLGPRYSGVVATWRSDGYGRIRVTGILGDAGDESKGGEGAADTASSSAPANTAGGSGADDVKLASGQHATRVEGDGAAVTAEAGLDARARVDDGAGAAAGDGKGDTPAPPAVSQTKAGSGGSGEGRAGIATSPLHDQRPPPVHTGAGTRGRPTKRVGSTTSEGDVVFVHRSQVRVVGGALPVLQPGAHVEFFVGINPVTKGKECCVHVTGPGGSPLPGALYVTPPPPSPAGQPVPPAASVSGCTGWCCPCGAARRCRVKQLCGRDTWLW